MSDAALTYPAGQTGAPRGNAERPLRLPRPIVYAERPEVHDTKFDRWGQRVAAAFVAQMSFLRSAQLRPILRRTNDLAGKMKAASNAELQDLAVELQRELHGSRKDKPLSVRAAAPAFALIREAADRVLGMRHYDVQLLGAWAMMKGMVAEMRTGEGKTLCATLAAATAALSGRPVHIVTVNDYLAERDAETMGPLYRFLGLSVGVVLAGQDPAARREIYQADIVYGTNKEMAFDYLRDRMALRLRPGNLRRKVERLSHDHALNALRLCGLHFVIVDEADSVLIDEARTPLIISGQVSSDGGVDVALFETAMDAAHRMTEGRHYRIPKDEKRIELLDAGNDLLDDIGEEHDGAFGVRVIREHAVTQALSALHLFHRDEAYIVRDDKVQIVDEYTGRVMEDRSWSEGLHQMIELKEGLEPTPPRETMSRITYQRFFRRYGQLSGMTGTASDSAWELWSVYRMPVVRISPNRPDIRSLARDNIYATEDKKWTAITDRVAVLHGEGKPVLLGTRSVAASEEASRRLTERGIPHKVLSASQDAEEAAIIAGAGEMARVTVATNMAGRGTDIKLAPGVAEIGGLHVILSERHDSRRVDRQLAGRCGRQGDPGRVEAFLSLEDELMRGKGSVVVLRRLALFLRTVLGARSGHWCLRLRQRQVEAIQARMRRDLLDADRNLSDLLAVSGELE